MMENYNRQDSEKQVMGFLKTLRADASRSNISVEFFQLTLQEPFYEKLNCAYTQSANKTQGLLYEAVTNRFFFVKMDNTGSPALKGLSKSVGTLLPKKLKDKMFWVCGNKTDKKLEQGDFTESFTLVKGGGK